MLIRKIFLFLICLVTVASISELLCNAYVDVSISAESAIVINADTNEIIFEKNSYKKMPMASTTKIMTSLLAVESGKLSDVVHIDGIAAEGTSIGLKNGDTLTLKSLVYGMLLESGNDAAQATATYLAGSEQAFAKLMNKKADSLHMNSTNFVTSSGLDANSHHSTAYDMALLGAFAIKNPLFRSICSDEKEAVEMISPEISLYMQNHNKLLTNCNGVFGIKTGFTKKSGRCLVTACERNGITLVAVTLNAPDDWNDHKKLYDTSYSALRSEEIILPCPEYINVYGADDAKVKVGINKNSYIHSYLKKEKAEIEVILPRIIYAPLNEGDVVGFVNVILGDKVIHNEPISALESVNKISGKEKPEPNFISKFFNIFF